MKKHLDNSSTRTSLIDFLVGIWTIRGLLNFATGYRQYQRGETRQILRVANGENENQEGSVWFREKERTTEIRGVERKLLSPTGKEVMLKSVKMALPTYTMSCFRLPKGLCKEINKMLARYWWGEKMKEKNTLG